MPALPTSDLRSEAKSYKRDKTHAVKWGRGGRVAPGKNCPHNLSMHGPFSCNDCVARPVQRDGTRNLHAHYWQRAGRTGMSVNGHRHRDSNVAKKVLQSDVSEVTHNSDTGSDDDVASFSEAPLLENEIMYSYDARSGPNTGADVLSHAVMQAVKKFENKQTEQLVKNEYDVVLDGKEAEDAYAGDAEDDFEFIDYEHLY